MERFGRNNKIGNSSFVGFLYSKKGILVVVLVVILTQFVILLFFYFVLGHRFNSISVFFGSTRFSENEKYCVPDYIQDPDKVVNIEELNLDKELVKYFKVIGDKSKPKFSKEYNYRVIDDSHEEYDIVEDELGYRYNNYVCGRSDTIENEFRWFQFFRTLLMVFDAYCKKLGVEYYLTHGGLLGYERDGASIPWDHDVDLIVNRADLIKLREGMPEVIVPGWYVIIHPDYMNERKDRRLCLCPKHLKAAKRCKFAWPVMRIVNTKYNHFLDVVDFVREDIDGEEIVRIPSIRGSELINKFRNDWILPKNSSVSCNFFDVDMPCPADRGNVLNVLYGPNWTVPSKRCNIETKTWEHTF